MKSILKIIMVSLICTITMIACARGNNVMVENTPTSESAKTPENNSIIGNTPIPEPAVTPVPELTPCKDDGAASTPTPMPEKTPRGHIHNNEKWQMLKAIMVEARRTSNKDKRANLQKEWINIVFAVPEDIQGLALDEYDLCCLSLIADLLITTRNFIWTDELSEGSLIGILEVYYNYMPPDGGHSYIASGNKYEMPTIQPDSYGYYCYDKNTDYFGRDDCVIIYNVIYQDTVNYFAQNLFGVTHPTLTNDFNIDDAPDDRSGSYREDGILKVG